MATLCSGGECVGVGARAAGYRHLWGIECLPEVANVAETNGFRSIIADVRDVDPRTLERPYALHVSPPCKEASGANGRRVESDDGRELGEVIVHFIEVLQPEVFTLENVWFYRTFDSFQFILNRLYALGYMVDYKHVNSADYGVPQTRMRLILRASQWLLPDLPEPEPWIGWYEAIEDLIPNLPDSQFAPWQLERLPESTKSLLVDSAGYPQGGSRAPVCREKAEPANTIVANHGRRPMRAFLVHPTDMRSMSIREGGKPAFTVMAGSFDESHAPAWKPRAFLVGSQYAQPNTVKDRRVQVKDSDEPSFTVVATYKGDKRAWLEDGRVVQLSVRALARLQSIPDTYRLPDKKALSCYVVGNAVPPLMYQKIISQL